MANITDPDRIATARARLCAAVVAAALAVLSALPAAAQAPAPVVPDDTFVVDDVTARSTR